MKIEMSMKITELPRGSWIGTLNPDIDIKIENDTYTIAEAIEIRDALTRIIEYVSFGAPELAVEKRKPRVFTRNSAEPVDVAKIKDAEGDVWIKVPEGWTLPESNSPYPWKYVLDEYPPLTEVIEA